MPNTYTIKEIKLALQQTHDRLYPEAYIGDLVLEELYNQLKKHLVQNRKHYLSKEIGKGWN